MTKSTNSMSARVVVPQSETDPSIVGFEEIPLPPEELWGDTEGQEPEAPTATTASSPVPEEAPPEIAVLDYVNTTHQCQVPLKHPFRLNGQLVDAVVVKRLTLGQVDGFVRRAASASFSTFDIYAVMTGLPAPVLRGLVDEDGDAVVDAAYDFLPRALKAETVSTET